MALFWCTIFEMLIALCEALDARAAADARAAVAAPSPRDAHAGPVLATGSRPGAMPRARPVLRLVQADDAPSTPLARDAALAGSAAPHSEGHLRAWSPPLARVELAPAPFGGFSGKKSAALVGFSTPKSLRNRNKSLNGLIGNRYRGPTAAKWMAGGCHRAPPGFPGQSLLESGSSETARAPI